MNATRKLSLLPLAMSAAALVVAPMPAVADFDGPVKVDCTKAANKTKPACKKKHGESLSNDEIYNAAYWMAKKGQYAAALAVLGQSKQPDDPRILTATGFATRKLGHVDAAMPYYQKALTFDPTLVATREYLGEAFLAKGDLASAKEQLSEIERRAGRASVTYAKLADEIAKFEAAGGSRS